MKKEETIKLADEYFRSAKTPNAIHPSQIPSYAKRSADFAEFYHKQEMEKKVKSSTNAMKEMLETFNESQYADGYSKAIEDFEYLFNIELPTKDRVNKVMYKLLSDLTKTEEG